MKNKLRVIFVSTLVLSLLTCPAFAVSSFPDVDASEEYTKAVEYLNSVGIMVGDDQGNFNPDKPVSRAEMATIICRLLGETENLPTSTQFSDVPTTHWANKYVSKAAELGIVNGYGDGKFGPSDTVKYEEALTMLVRTQGLEELALATDGYPDGYINVACEYGFTDWVAAEKGDKLTRWQIAMILYNVIIYHTPM